MLQFAAENAALTEAARVAAAYDATERDALLEDVRLLRTRILSEHQKDGTADEASSSDVPPSPASNQRQWLQEQLTSTQVCEPLSPAASHCIAPFTVCACAGGQSGAGGVIEGS